MLNPHEREASDASCPRDRSPLEVVHLLVPGDPLRLRGRVRRGRRRHAVLVPLRRLVARTCARVAWDASERGAEEPLDAWLDGRVDRAVDELVREQSAEELAQVPPHPEGELPFYRIAARALGVTPLRGRLACAAVNALPFRVRVALLTARWPSYPAPGEDLPADEIRRLAHRAERAVRRVLDRAAVGLVTEPS